MIERDTLMTIQLKVLKKLESKIALSAHTLLLGLHHRLLIRLERLRLKDRLTG